MTRPLLTASVLAALAVATPARAQSLEAMANPRSVLPGGEAAMLGGAFTAVADDPSASYYNPAGLVFLSDEKLSMSTTDYQTSTLVYHDALGSQPFVARSQSFYPNFIGGAMKLGNVALGYSFITLDARNIYQEDKFDGLSTATKATNSYSRTRQEDSTYIWAGGSLAVQLGDHLAFGGSVFYYQRDIEFSSNEIDELNGGGVYNVNATLKTLNTGLAGVNGLFYKDDHWSYGLAVRTAMGLKDKSSLHVNQLRYDPANSTPTQTSVTSPYHPLDELNPTTIVVGTAFRSEHVQLSADLMQHEGVSATDHADGGEDLHTTWNGSVGLALKAGPLAVLGGYFTNNSLYRRPDPATPGQPAYVNWQGTSAGAILDLGPVVGELGTVRQFGKGQAQIRTGDPAVQSVDGSSTVYVMSAKVRL